MSVMAAVGMRLVVALSVVDIEVPGSQCGAGVRAAAESGSRC